ncbi:MAG TPA: phosphoribosylformylglycinamidine cyclo-ligase, partial [Thermoplasmata archaeon]|nr:phosphoribosylformylglycinamidine cyclo-ligase [Thermoplasmata archaeon]
MVRTYAESGVSQDEKAAHIAALVSGLTFHRRGTGRPLTRIGHFTGLVEFGKYALSLCTDGVGTKLIVAGEMRKWDTVGIDCVAMNVNDMICIGAEPVAFVDYFAIEFYDHEVARQLGVGLNLGAKAANVSIIGGEVAVLPEIVKGFDLAGTCFGVVDRKRIIDGRAVRPGDVIIGLPSHGIHSNGLTLARRLLRDAALTVFDPVGGTNERWGPALLEPTAIYVKPVLKVLERATVHGMAHVTGGGVRNLARLKPNVEFAITEPLEPQPLFRELQALGGIEAAEMYQTFNMGMGYAIVAPKDEAETIVKGLRPSVKARVVGEVRKGVGVSLPALGLH